MTEPRDADATRARILEAATAEFARYGLAGARVDRISERARANKSLIYAYFGKKDDLFDRVVEAAFESMHAAVPLIPNDMTGYATALYDYLADQPDLLRIDAWRRLERPEATGPELEAYATQVHDLSAIQPTYGMHKQFLPADFIVIVIAIASAWAHSPDGIRPHATQDRARQRELVAGAVAVLTKYQKEQNDNG